MKRLIVAFALLFAFTGIAQATTVSLLPLPKQEFRNQLGTAACSGCLLYSYEPGSTTMKSTYSDSTGLVANVNPVVADTAGRMSVWGNGCYKLILKSSAGATIATQDNVCEYITNVAAVSQWQASGLTATYVSGTSFSVPGDNTAVFVSGTRLQSTNTGGTIYSTVVSSAYTSVTTVVVSNDSGTLDSGLSAVNIGLITVSNSSLPMMPVSTKTGGYTILPTDCGKTLIANLTTAATFTLPAANAVPSKCSIITKVTGSILTLAATIDGVSNPTMGINESATVWSDGTSWYRHDTPPTVSLKTGGYTITTSDMGSVIQGNLTSNATFTLPAASAVIAGRGVVTKNASAYTLTLGGTVDGTANPTINNTQSMTLYSDGTNWKEKKARVNFRGALVYLGANYTLATGATGTIIAFGTTVYDTDSIHADADLTKFTVPTGVTKIKLGFGVAFSQATTTTGLINCYVVERGDNGPPAFLLPSLDQSMLVQDVVSPVINTTGGAVYHVKCIQTSGANRTLYGGSSATDMRTYAFMEIIE